GLDAYGEAGALGYDTRSVQAWAPDGGGARHAFQAVSHAAEVRRLKLARGDAFDYSDFFEGTKTAEADRDRRHARTRREDWWRVRAGSGSRLEQAPFQDLAGVVPG